MGNYNSSLILQKMVFDEIKFERKGFKNSLSEFEMKLNVQIGVSKDNVYKVTLTLVGEKKEEYDIVIRLSGFFELEGHEEIDNEVMQDLINKNTVAIMMPYLRSELTLLTSQPDTESVVLPPLNINKMLKK